jgi:hypothetical protein
LTSLRGTGADHAQRYPSPRHCCVKARSRLATRPTVGPQQGKRSRRSIGGRI